MGVAYKNVDYSHLTLIGVDLERFINYYRTILFPDSQIEELISLLFGT